MTLALLRKPSAIRARMRAQRSRPSLVVEGLESRTVLSAGGLTAPVPLAAQLAANAQIAVSIPINITNVNLNHIGLNSSGGVTATGTLTGTLEGHQFTTPVTLALTPPTGSQSCPVLDLSLAPIHLSLLGLNVDTSAICLDITATPGTGNVLGNLLCGTLDTVTNDLTAALNIVNGGGLLNLSGVLNDLNTILANTSILGGIDSLLSQATPRFGSPTVTGATTNVLNLSLGPVDLSLLGLNVHLDNCANGPITVSITATQGPGNLLGNLISSLSHLLDNSGNTTGAVLTQLNKVLGILQNA